MTQNDRDWVRWAEYVLASIEAHNDAISKQWDIINELRLKVNTLEVKSAIYGAILGFLAGAAPSLIPLIMSRM